MRQWPYQLVNDVRVFLLLAEVMVKITSRVERVLFHTHLREPW